MWLKEKAAELASKTKSEDIRWAIWRAEGLIDDCVVATNQNYVEGLKGTDGWTKEAQAEALKRTTTAVFGLVTNEVMELLQMAFTDATAWINQRIDKSVNDNKVKVE